MRPTTPVFARGLTAAACVMLVSCSTYQPSVPPSQGHLSRDKSTAGTADAPLPVVSAPGYVPPPKPKPKVPTYSVVVHEVPVKELLLALARDTKENIDIHPGLQGLVSLNAIDEPLNSILDRVAKQVDMRYRVEGRTIIVSPDTPYMKTYQVNYVNMSRDTTSTVSVSGQISGGGGGSAKGGAAPASAQGGQSTTSVNSSSKNNFWDLLKENILISCLSPPMTSRPAPRLSGRHGKTSLLEPNPSQEQAPTRLHCSIRFSGRRATIRT
jgi:Secretin N-terminal domain